MRNRFWRTFAACALLLVATSATADTIIDENNGYNGSSISTVGATLSDFYAQSFIANVTNIRRFGVVVGESSPEGQIRLSITTANALGLPNVDTPLYTGPLIDPTPTMTWFYETGLNVPVVPGKRYFILIDGYQNAGATGNSRIGRSNNMPIPDEPMIYTNDHGTSWGSVSDAIAIYVEGDKPVPVPTLSTLMLGLVAAALAAAGVLRRRH